MKSQILIVKHFFKKNSKEKNLQPVCRFPSFLQTVAFIPVRSIKTESSAFLIKMNLFYELGYVYFFLSGPPCD